MATVRNQIQEIPHGHAPFYGEKDQATILRLLAVSYLECRRALDRLMLPNLRKDVQEAVRGQIEYWEHAITTIDVIAMRVLKRQKHLLVFDDQQITELIEKWRARNQKELDRSRIGSAMGRHLQS